MAPDVSCDWSTYRRRGAASEFSRPTGAVVRPRRRRGCVAKFRKKCFAMHAGLSFEGAGRVEYRRHVIYFYGFRNRDAAKHASTQTGPC
jgi:hypothetical protein